MITSRNILPAIVCLFLSSCITHHEEQEQHRYKITADVKNCEGCEVMMRAEAHRDFEKIDSTVVKNGTFVLEGNIQESGFYEVSLHNPKKGFINPIVYLPADSVHLTIDAENKVRSKFYTREDIGSWLKHGSATSISPIQRELEKYFLTRDSLWSKFLDDNDLVLEKYRQTYDSGDKALVQQWADSLETMKYRFTNYFSYAADLFIQNGASPEATMYAIMDNKNDRMATDRFKSYFASLPATHQQSAQGQYLTNYLRENEQRNKNNQRFVNGRIRNLDLAGSTPEGNTIDESEIFKANKLTLIEFWASWCGPCRMEMPKYYQLYEQYREKGFGFIAVSMDNSRDMWLKAVEQDKLEVHHISELRGTAGEDMKRFEIKGIPANMLVDNTGKIVAVDIKKLDLRKKLENSL